MNEQYKTIAKIFSYIFHPLIIPTLGMMIIFNTNSYVNFAIPFELKKAVTILVGLSTFIIPSLMTLLLLNRGYIKSVEMETTKERILPYGFTIVFYFFTIYMMLKAPIPPIIFNFMIGALVSVILAFIINLRWKISAHMTGMGGLTGALIAISFLLSVNLIPFIALAILISGLVASSRLILNAHDPLQLVAGFFLGIFCQVFSIYF
ncbi:MAG: PAP2 family protein [Flavobacteriales bacterium]|nr:PAP2 family protein [Flavobacteriales bacterium]